MKRPLFEGSDVTDFVALYRGRTVLEAELVAVSAEAHLVRRFVSELLGEPESEQEAEEPAHPTRALEIVQDE